jgi:hypothetical protein
MVDWLYRYVFRGWGVLLVVGIITMLVLAIRSQGPGGLQDLRRVHFVSGWFLATPVCGGISRHKPFRAPVVAAGVATASPIPEQLQISGIRLVGA